MIPCPKATITAVSCARTSLLGPPSRHRPRPQPRPTCTSPNLRARAHTRTTLRSYARSRAQADWVAAIKGAQGKLARERQTQDLRRGSGGRHEDATVENAPLMMPDTERCQLCSKGFGLITRRHHCRACGRCVCATCSDGKIKNKRACFKCVAREKARRQSMMRVRSDPHLAGAGRKLFRKSLDGAEGALFMQSMPDLMYKV